MCYILRQHLKVHYIASLIKNNHVYCFWKRKKSNWCSFDISMEKSIQSWKYINIIQVSQIYQVCFVMINLALAPSYEFKRSWWFLLTFLLGSNLRIPRIVFMPHKSSRYLFPVDHCPNSSSGPLHLALDHLFRMWYSFGFPWTTSQIKISEKGIK